jgi:1-deoxy-D-xylulose-5-phosphate synthase
VPDPVAAVRSEPDHDVLVERAGTAADACTVLIVNYGALTAQSVAAADAVTAAGHTVTVVDPVWVTPVAASLVDLVAASDLVITVEDGGVHGGAGQQLHRAAVDREVDTPFRYLAIPQEFLDQGSRAEVLADIGLDTGSVTRRVTDWLGTGAEG